MQQAQKLAEKYFKKENIESLKTFGTHLILSLKDMEEDAESAEMFKKDILDSKLFQKVSVIFTTRSSAQSIFEQDQKWSLPGIRKIIGVASGKGGVGKSTTSVNLALALANSGLKTALFDADIYGPSVPTMLGYENNAPISYDGKRFEPFQNGGIKSMSIGTLVAGDTPLIWRGAKACGAIEQLLTQTNWGEIDVMVIDMPPGTGDIQITLSQKICLDGVVIVSTPQDIALIDAVKGVNMFEKTGVQILGIVENMSYYICEKCGTRADIFGHAGAKETAHRLGQRFLGEIPLHISIRQNADNGTPIVSTDPQSPYTKAYEDIAAKIKSILCI